MKTYELFEYLAEHTWRMIARCHSNKLHLGEDAVSTINLDALITASPGFLALEDSRADEYRKGCDFELWVGCSSSGWIRFAVQAKKIAPSSGRYNSLNHVVKSSGIKQIDVLEKYSKTNRAFPIYCFYNISDPPTSLPRPWKNKYKWNCCVNEDELQLGCSVTPAAVVKKAIKSGPRNFQFIHNRDETLPWRCLIRCSAQCPFNHLDSKLGKVLERIEGWGGIRECFHEKLPEQITEFTQHRSYRIPFDELQGVFSRDSDFKPTWLGVLDLSAGE